MGLGHRPFGLGHPWAGCCAASWCIAFSIRSVSSSYLSSSWSQRSCSTSRRLLIRQAYPSRQLVAGIRLNAAQMEDQDDLLKWDRMYEEGSRRSARALDDFENNGLNSLATQKCEVRVISFDLDNTLWNTTATISEANQALADFLEKRNILQPIRVEMLMGQLFQKNKERYCPLEKDQARSPVLLTLLRKDALTDLLMQHNGFSKEQAEPLADQAFDEWARARHASIAVHLASSVQSCLDEIISLRTSKGHPLLVCAITDGNAQPGEIECLAGYFDFCVNAEMVGVSKPDKQVFLRATRQALQYPCLEDIVGEKDRFVAEQDLLDFLGPWWVHIGDDFVKDVVAAKGLNMRTIWSRELTINKAEVAPMVRKAPPSNGGAVEELVKRIAQTTVLEMQVGADDYLADSILQEFADAVVNNFCEIATLIKSWQLQANKAEPSKRNVMRIDPPSSSDEGNVRDYKFCIECAEKLPIQAKFCSSCGVKLS